jgi:hypothetical protein
MNKFSRLIVPMLLASSITLSPSTNNAQDDKQTEFERSWHNTCYTQKDTQKCYESSKELVEKYPRSTYLTHAQNKIKEYVGEKFEADLKAYYTPPQDAAKLDQLFASGESYLKIDPASQFVIAHMALAGANGALGEFYKDFGKVKGYADTALKTFASTSPPEGWKLEGWSTMRDLVLAQTNQYMGWMLINQHPDPAQVSKGDQEQAINYLAQATQIKGKDGTGWKDPSNYWLRSIIYNNQCAELKKPYDAMTDEQKLSEAGKEVRQKFNELLDTKLIPEYARVLATATRPESKSIYDAAKLQFDSLWKYRTDAPEKADAYVKNYAADPTIASLAVPAKAEDTSNLTGPITGPANVKLSTGGSAMVPGTGGKASPSSNGRQSAPAKGNATKRGARRKGKNE